MPILTLALCTLLLGLLPACVTGFETHDPRGRDDDDSSLDDDDTALDDDDDSTPADDDDGTPADDDDGTPADDDDSVDHFEGDEPGECSDGADNDQDGLFDCDDPNCAGSPDCQGDDDDASPTDGAPEITNVTYVWTPVEQTFEFSIDIVDWDCDLTPVILWWSFTGEAPAPLGAVGNSTPNCSTTYLFGLEIVNSGPGLSYSVTLSVEDSSGNRSNEHTLVAMVPN